MNSYVNDYYPGMLLSAHGSPCISLYQPTHRRHPDKRQDPIRFRNLLKAAEKSLLQKYATHEVESLLQPFHALADDYNFWKHTLDGLAVLGALDNFHVYRPQRSVPELAIVADSLHTKPLLRIFQSADRYQVLHLNRQKIKLFEGNRDSLDEVELARGVPQTIIEALGEELTEPHLTVSSYGMGAEGPAMHHGHGARKDEVDIDEERFFRAVDKAILEKHSRPSGLPLILATLPEHDARFRQVSRNPFLIAEGIGINPDSLPIDALRNLAWQVVEPYYHARLSRLVEEFENASAKELGSHDLTQIAAAAVGGRVATLLIEADRQIPGRIDLTTGRIQFDDLTHPTIDDILDDLGELVLNKGGQVIVVPAERMPTRTEIAASYRF